MNYTVVLDRQSPVPLYHQLAASLKEGITSGCIPKGSLLGNEVGLADRWSVSRPTVRRAIEELVGDGFLVRRRGVGTQVVNDEVRRPFTLSSLYDDLNASGRRPTTRVLACELVPSPATVAESLQVEPGSPVLFIRRVRSTNDVGLAVMSNWLLASIDPLVSADDLVTAGLYSLLRKGGVRPHYAVQRLGARVATREEASLLNVEARAPLVTMRRVMQDDTGRAIEVGDHVYDARHYVIEMSVVES